MIQKPRGTYDIFNNEIKIWTYIENKIRMILNDYNYKEIRTPIFESKSLFVRSIGTDTDIVTKEMYEIIDKKNREFVLKPEGTAPIVRAFIENKLYTNENLPFKSYYISPMFRYERPQVGRTRQFHQLGVERFGNDSISVDIEIILIANRILKALNLDDKIEIHINYLIDKDNKKRYIDVLTNKLKEKDLCDDCKIRITKNTLRVLDCKVDNDKFSDLPIMYDFLNHDDKNRFDKTLQILKNHNLNIIKNFNLVRGLDYYTGLIFEFKYIDKSLASQQTIIGGGRYNNLVNEIGNKNVPALGFAMGLERVVHILKNKDNINYNTNDYLDFYSIVLTDKAIDLNWKILEKLIDKNYKIDTNNNEYSLKASFKYADKFNAKNIIIIGEKELEKNTIIIKNKIDNTQTEININDIDKLF